MRVDKDTIFLIVSLRVFRPPLTLFKVAFLAIDDMYSTIYRMQQLFSFFLFFYELCLMLSIIAFFKAYLCIYSSQRLSAATHKAIIWLFCFFDPVASGRQFAVLCDITPIFLKKIQKLEKKLKKDLTTSDNYDIHRVSNIKMRITLCQTQD